MFSMEEDRLRGLARTLFLSLYIYFLLSILPFGHYCDLSIGGPSLGELLASLLVHINICKSNYIVRERFIDNLK